jgi:hypothetical protein
LAAEPLGSAGRDYMKYRATTSPYNNPQILNPSFLELALLRSNIELVLMHSV